MGIQSILVYKINAFYHTEHATTIPCVIFPLQVEITNKCDRDLPLISIFCERMIENFGKYSHGF